MEQYDSFSGEFSELSSAGRSGISQDSLKLESLIGLTKDQLEELRKLNSTSRTQTQMSPYSMYTDQAISTAHSNGIYMPSGSAHTSNLMDRYKNSAVGGIASGVILDRTRTSSVDREKMAQQSGHGIANVGSAGVGAAAGALSSFAAYGLVPGLVAPMAIGAAGGWAAEKTFGAISDRVSVHQAYNDRMLSDSYRFINSRESNNTRTGVGFNRSEMHSSATFLREMGTDKSMEDGEISMLLEKFTDSGMLRSTSNLDGFKDKMSKLTDIVKQSALMLNESFEGVADMLGELERQGISSNNYDSVLGKMKALGGLTGKSGAQMMGEIAPVVDRRVYGTSMDAENQYTSAAIERSSLSHIYDTANKDLSDPSNQRLKNIIKNSGGEADVSNMLSQGLQNAVYEHGANAMVWAFDYDNKTGNFAFNKDRFDKGLNENTTLQELSARSTDAIRGWGDEGALAWMSKSKSAFGDIDKLSEYKIINAIGNATAIDTGLSKDSALELRLNDSFGGNAELMEIMIKHQLPNMINNGDFYKADIEKRALLEIAQSQHDATNLGPIGTIKRWGDKAGDWLARGPAKLSDRWSDKMVGFSDMLYGRTNMYQQKYDSINVDLHSQNMIDVLDLSSDKAAGIQNRLDSHLRESMDMSFTERVSGTSFMPGYKIDERATDYTGMKKQYGEFSEYASNTIGEFFKGNKYSGESQEIKNSANDIFEDFKSGEMPYEQAEKALESLGASEVVNTVKQLLKTESQFKKGMSLHSEIEEIGSGEEGLLGNFARAAITIGNLGDKKLRKELGRATGLKKDSERGSLGVSFATLKQLAEDPSSAGKLMEGQQDKIIEATQKSLTAFVEGTSNRDLRNLIAKDYGEDSADAVLKHKSSSGRVNEWMNIIMNTPQEPGKEKSDIEGAKKESTEAISALTTSVEDNTALSKALLVSFETQNKDIKDYLTRLNNVFA